MIALEDTVPLLIDAAKFAAEKHKTQMRKDGVTPYINHPVDVVEILWKVGEVRDGVTLIAAFLHDTIEDTDTTANEIANRFGDEVASVVLEVTDDKTLSKAERKQRQIDTAPHKSNRAKILKIADKASNIKSLIELPPTDWSNERIVQYLDWSEKVVAGLRGQNSKLEVYYDTLLAKARQIYE